MVKNHLDISGIFLLSYSAVASQENIKNFKNFPTMFSFSGHQNQTLQPNLLG